MNLTPAFQAISAPRLGLAVISALLLSCGSPGPAPAPPSSTSGSSGSPAPAGSASAFASQIATATQRYRASKGKSALIRHPGLDSLAAQHAQYMARTAKVGHDGWGGRFKTAKSQFGFVSANENVMRGSSRDRSQWTAISMDSWKNSKGHNRNLLASGSSHYGVGAAIGADGFFNVVYISGGK